MLGKEDSAIGSILLHTEAPREFTEEEAEFLVSSASLVAGAIENARLYEEARRRVAELEQLTQLAEAVARAETLDELLPAVADRARGLLSARTCSVYLLGPGGDELQLSVCSPVDAEVRRSFSLTEVGPELARGKRSATVSVPLRAGDELLGLLRAEGATELELARAVANQAAVALVKIDLIDRLTERNLIKDFFEELAGGRESGNLAERAERLGADLESPHVVIVASPANDRLERALAAAAPGSLFDRREDSLRALLHVPRAGSETLLESLRRVHAELPGPVAIGASNVCHGAASFAAAFEEAGHALLGATVLTGKPALMSYDELGPYKYLLRMSTDGDIRDSNRDAIDRLAAYDAERSASLLLTLEEFLRRRGNISATSEALFVHPNTLRQRLRRISEVSGIDLRQDDWLMIEIAVKLVRLKQAAAPDPGQTSGSGSRRV